MPMTDAEPERPDDTWLREGGNEDVADYIVAVVQRADRAEAEVERLKAAHEQDKDEAWIEGWNQGHMGCDDNPCLCVPERKGGSA